MSDYEEIPLRARDGSIRAITRVSPEDFEWLSTHRWKLTGKGYAQRERKRNGKWESVRMHRAIVGLEPGDPLQADHVNRDKLDNRRSNLRVVTDLQQRENVPARGGSSLHRGVFRHVSGTWQARVRRVNLGTFSTEAEAAVVVQQARAVLMPYAVD